MIRLSVNVNKIATIRNSRGGSVPRVLDAVQVCVDAGAHGITVHPRADRRHITPEDVHDIAHALAPLRPKVEFNIEGDPRPDLLALVKEVRPDQCTLVPVMPGEITSQAGWVAATAAGLPAVVRELKAPWDSREPVRRSDGGGHPACSGSGRGSRGAVYRTVRAGIRARPRRGGRVIPRVRAAPPSSPTLRASASTPGTTSISRI